MQTREWVLQVGYWQVDHVAFSVFPWSPDGNLSPPELLTTPTWVVLKNVPPQLYSLDGISLVASRIGEPFHTEKSRLDPYHFGNTKIKVEISLEETPPEVVEVRNTVGNKARINVEYPRLPLKCCNCGRFGHLMRRCPKPAMKKTSQLPKPESTPKIASVTTKVSLENSQEDQITSIDQPLSVSSLVRIISLRYQDGGDPALGVRKTSNHRGVGEEAGYYRCDPSAGVSLSVSIPEQEPPHSKQLPPPKPIQEAYNPQLSTDEISGQARAMSDSEIEISSDDTQTTNDTQLEKEVPWLIKFSKKARRAMRQKELWQLSKNIDTPGKSPISQGSSLGRRM